MLFIGSVRVPESFGKLWRAIMLFSRTWKGLEKGGFSNWAWNSFGFLFGKILKYPKMDVT